MDGRDIEVLHREAGYLRLRLPAHCRSAAIGSALQAGLSSLPGLARVTWLTPEGKLAVRFDPRTATHADVARRIKAVLAGLGETPAAAPEPAEAMPGESLAERLEDLRARLVALAPQRLRSLIESATTEKAATNFANDIVAFYLIKVHWELIVNRWLKEPVKYGNAWLTVFYLVFLLVRYRKS